MPLILPNNIANDQVADGDLLQQNFATIEDWANQEAITRDGATAMTGALLLPGPPTQPNQAATKAYVDGQRMIGEFTGWAGKTEPPGWMFCRGQQLSRATYAALFAVIGTDYGAGDGSTTFHLPSFQGRFPIGVYPGGPWANVLGQVGGNADAIVPSHTHAANAVGDHGHFYSGTTAVESQVHHHALFGAADQTQSGGFGEANIANHDSGFPFLNSYTGGQNTNHNHTFSGATTFNGAHTPQINAAGSDATNGNMPPYTAANFIIKVA